MEKMYNSYSGKDRTNSNLSWHRPQTAAFREEEELMKKSQNDLMHTTDPLEKLRLMCFTRGASGIMVFGRIFRSLDNDGSKQLSKQQFRERIKETGLELTGQDLDELFDKFDTEKSGMISLDEFLEGVVPPMSESRRSIVEQVFRMFDTHGHGEVTIQDIRKKFSVRSNAMYMTGEDSADTVMTAFLAHFETDEQVDEKVTLEEFMNYYSGVSQSVDSDCKFDLMMRQAFKL